jgi:hypothetical protein
MNNNTNNIFALPIKAHGLKPVLIGGDEPPQGFRHKVFTLSSHHLYVISVMADHFNLAEGKLLANIMQNFIDTNRPLVDSIFKTKALTSNKKYEGS